MTSRIDSAQKLALIVCPKYDENHFLWKCVINLMSQYEMLGKKMSKLKEDDAFGEDKDGKSDNICNIIDLSNIFHL